MLYINSCTKVQFPVGQTAGEGLARGNPIEELVG